MVMSTADRSGSGRFRSQPAGIAPLGGRRSGWSALAVILLSGLVWAGACRSEPAPPRDAEPGAEEVAAPPAEVEPQNLFDPAPEADPEAAEEMPLEVVVEAAGAAERVADEAEGLAAQAEVGAGVAAERTDTPPASLEALRIDLGAMAFDEGLDRFVVPLPGERRAVLTLAPDLQRHLTSVVARYDEPAAAVVAIEPATGRVLAYVEAQNELLEEGLHPAGNPVAWAASIFKIVSGAILVEERNLGPGRRMCVPPGRGELEEADLVSDEARDTRCVDFVQAMAESVNAYFARLFVDELSPELIEAWLLRFGFNREIPFELATGPSQAVVPSSHLERGRMGAGFRHAHLSPLHGALIVAAIANGGVMMRPTLVDRVLDAEGEVVLVREPEVWLEVTTRETARILTEVLSTTTVSGTAARYFSGRAGWPRELRVAGKTGTLSNRTGGEGPEPSPLIIYSWFTGFAPIEEPTIAVAGLVHNSERWHIRGSYLASEAVLQYLWR